MRMLEKEPATNDFCVGLAINVGLHQNLVV